MINKETGKCCLCGGEYTMGGCNPDPVCTIPDARCCHKCNVERVLPARGMEQAMSFEECFTTLEHTDKSATVEIYTNNDEEEHTY